MVYLLFSPSYGLEVDLNLDLAYDDRHHPGRTPDPRRAAPGLQPTPPDPQILGQFVAWTCEKDTVTGVPRWQSFDTRPEREQSYAVWVTAIFRSCERARLRHLKKLKKGISP
jgi:hypothetical protein